MTTTFATLLSPSKRPAGRRRNRWRQSRGTPLVRGVATLALAACFAAACGGQSVRRVGTNDGEHELDGDDGKLGANELDACVSVCVTCFAEQRSCEKDCGQILDQAVEAGCAAALDALLACRIDLVSCSATSCPDANNDLSVCVLKYCDGHPNAAVCTSPL